MLGVGIWFLTFTDKTGRKHLISVAVISILAATTVFTDIYYCFGQTGFLNIGVVIGLSVFFGIFFAVAVVLFIIVYTRDRKTDSDVLYDVNRDGYDF